MATPYIQPWRPSHVNTVNGVMHFAFDLFDSRTGIRKNRHKHIGGTYSAALRPTLMSNGIGEMFSGQKAGMGAPRIKVLLDLQFFRKKYHTFLEQQLRN